MLRIALCDDDPSVRELFCRYTDRFAKEKMLDIQYNVYCDGTDILHADYSAIDLLIIDIQMPGMNGLETARIIRETNKALTIIFLTNYIQYALQGYEVQAFRFLLKPLDYAQYADVVEKVLAQMNLLQKSFLTFQSNDNVVRIAVGDISYIETDRGRTLIHHMNNVTPSTQTMQNLEIKLQGQAFFRCHKAYIVSLKEIRTVTLQDVILSDSTVIPLSKHRKKALKEALTIYWGEQLQ